VSRALPKRRRLQLDSESYERLRSKCCDGTAGDARVAILCRIYRFITPVPQRLRGRFGKESDQALYTMPQRDTLFCRRTHGFEEMEQTLAKL
jgi:hypothetical protein